MADRHGKRESDEDLQKRQASLERERRKQRQLHNDRVELLKLEEFQRVMSDILAKGGMFQSVMTGNSWSYHKSGRQDFTREIWADMASSNTDAAFDLLKPKFGEEFDG